MNAAAALGSLGPEAKAAVPMMMKHWRETPDYDFKCEMLRNMARIKSNTDTLLPLCIAIINDPQQEPYYACAAASLGEIGPEAKSGIPHLLKLFERCRSLKQPAKAPTIRANILHALGKMGKEAEEATVPAIIGYCADPTLLQQTRHTAFMALGEIGPSAKDAIPFLIGCLQKREYNEYHRVMSAALRGIGKEAVKPLINAYLAAPEAAKESLIRTLGYMGSLAIEAVPLLEKELSNRRHGTAASIAIERIIPRNP